MPGRDPGLRQPPTFPAAASSAQATPTLASCCKDQVPWSERGIAGRERGQFRPGGLWRSRRPAACSCVTRVEVPAPSPPRLPPSDPAIASSCPKSSAPGPFVMPPDWAHATRCALYFACHFPGPTRNAGIALAGQRPPPSATRLRPGPGSACWRAPRANVLSPCSAQYLEFRDAEDRVDVDFCPQQAEGIGEPCRPRC